MFAQAEELFAQGRVDDDAVALVVFDAVVAEDLGGVNGVVLFVEQWGAVVGGAAHVPQAGEAADDRQDDGGDPGAQPIIGEVAEPAAVRADRLFDRRDLSDGHHPAGWVGSGLGRIGLVHRRGAGPPVTLNVLACHQPGPPPNIAGAFPGQGGGRR